MEMMDERRIGDRGTKVRGGRDGSSHCDLDRGKKGQEPMWLVVQSQKSL